MSNHMKCHFEHRICVKINRIRLISYNQTLNFISLTYYPITQIRWRNLRKQSSVIQYLKFRTLFYLISSIFFNNLKLLLCNVN